MQDSVYCSSVKGSVEKGLQPYFLCLFLFMATYSHFSPLLFFVILLDLSLLFYLSKGLKGQEKVDPD